MTVDKIIIGAGLYGLYAAQKCGAAGQRVLVLERDPAPFMRATYINQARVHMGYHYPRSYSTAIKSAHYFERFCNDYGFCLHTEFDQVYATSAHFSWTNAAEFRRFCAAAGIRCDDVAPERYFNPGLCDGAFLTTRAALRHMYKDDRGGVVIYMGSVHSHEGSPLKSAYVAAKHGIVGLTKVTALETAPTGVTCNAICPGWVLTPLVQKQVDAKAQQLGVSNEEAKKVLLGEKEPSMQFTTPEELGALAVFFCSPAANNVRGVAWNMDGGWTAQ